MEETIAITWCQLYILLYIIIDQNFKEMAYCNIFNIVITKISIILQSIAMTNMKLQWIYYYNDLIPIILQYIVRKNMKNLTITIYIPLQ